MIHGLAPLLACALALPSGQDVDRATPKDMRPLAPLVGGRWRFGDGAPFPGFQQCDWGAARASIHVSTWRAGEEHDVPWSQSLLYWDPGEKQLRVVGLTPLSFYEGRIVVDGTTWTERADVFREGERSQSLTRWTWPEDDDVFRWQLLDPRGVEPQLDVKVEREARGKLRAAAGEAELAKELAPLARLVGHVWEVDAKWPNGAPFRLRTEFSRGILPRVVESRTWRLPDEGEPEPIVDSYYYWHPGREELRLLAVGAEEVAEGSVAARETGLFMDYEMHSGGNTVPIHETWEFASATSYVMKIWTDGPADERRLLMETEVKGRPAGD